MVIKAMNVDALPMLYSSTIGLKMPLDYNTLSPLEIFQSKECTKFSESLRTTAVYMANSVCVVERLKIPTILSMSLSRTQLYEWQDAINAAHFIVAMELITPILDAPKFKYMVQVGPSIPIPQEAGVAFGHDSFRSTDTQLSIFVNSTVWNTLCNLKPPTAMGGFPALLELFPHIDAVVPNIPHGLLLRPPKHHSNKPPSSKRAVDKTRNDSDKIPRRTAAIVDKPTSRKSESRWDVVGEEVQPAERNVVKYVKLLTFQPMKAVDMSTEKLNLIWDRAEQEGMLTTAVQDAINYAMNRRTDKPKSLLEQIAAAESIDQLEALFDKAAQDPDDGKAFQAIASKMSSLAEQEMNPDRLSISEPSIPIARQHSVAPKNVSWAPAPILKRKSAPSPAAESPNPITHESRKPKQEHAINWRLDPSTSALGLPVDRILLDARLVSLWPQLQGVSNELSQPRQVSYNDLKPLLAEFGCLVGTVMQEWVIKLGELRALDAELNKSRFLSFPTDDIQVIHLMARKAGFETILTDGSCVKMPKKNKNRSLSFNLCAGAAAFNMNNPHAPCLMKVSGDAQTNSRAEYEAGLVALIMEPCNLNTLIVSDSEDFAKVADADTREVARRAALGGVLKNAKPVLLIKLLQLIAPGAKQVMNMRAHCGCVIQDKIDEYAKEATTLTEVPELNPAISLVRCTEVLASWALKVEGKTELFKDIGVKFLMSGGDYRLNMQELAKPENARALRKLMAPVSATALYDTLAIVDNLPVVSTKLGSLEARSIAAKKCARVENAWRLELVTSTLQITGAQKIGSGSGKGNTPRHTPAYSDAQLEIIIISATIQAAKECIEARKPGGEMCEDKHGALCNIINALGNDGIGTVSALPHLSAAEMIEAIAVYTQGKPLDRAQMSYTAVRKLLERAELAIEIDQTHVDALATDDIQQHKFNKVFAIWASKGQCKALKRAVDSATAKNKFSFAIDPMVFITEVANKSKLPAIARNPFEITIMQHQVLAISSDSEAEFAAPWTATHVARELYRAPNGKAFSRKSQMSKEMLKILANLSAEIGKLKARIDSFDPEMTSLASLQHLQEALEAATVGAAEGAQGAKDVCALIAAIFNAMEATGIANHPWHLILLSPIFKNKVDPSTTLAPDELAKINCDSDHWREVAQADALRTLYGSCVHTAWTKYSKANQLHRFAQLAYLSGIDAMALHHLRFDLVQHLSMASEVPWAQHPMCVAVLAADFKHFFSTFTTETREIIMEENLFPENRRQGMRAIHKGMQVAMIHEGKTSETVPIDFEIMGSAEACTMATAAFTAYNQQLDEANRGFRLPPADLFDLPQPPSPHLFGGEQCDDITLFAGGFGKSPAQTVEDIEWQGRLTAEMASSKGFVFSINSAEPAKSKCITFATLTDQYGFQAHIDINIWLPTQAGVERVPMLPEGTAFKMLGVMRMRKIDEQATENATMCAGKTVTKLNEQINDRFPTGAQVAALRNSVTGGLRWAAEKTTVPWEVIKAAVKLEASEAKAVLGLGRSTLSAYIFASIDDGGCGITNSELEVTAQGVALLIANLNSNHEFIKRLMRYSIEVCRVSNHVIHDGKSPFFGWKIDDMCPSKVDKLAAPTCIITSLRFAIEYGANFVFTSDDDCHRFSLKWKGIERCTCDTGLIKDIIKDIFRSRWRQQMLESSVDVAAKECVDTLQSRRANLWRKDKNLSNSVFKTATRACVDVVSTHYHQDRTWRDSC